MSTAKTKKRGIKNGSSGRFTPTHALNDSQAVFVREYVANGGDRQKAATEAGYSNPRTEGYRLLNTDKVRIAIQQETARAIRCEGATRGLAVMQELLEPPAPASVRLQAARWVLGAAGFGTPMPEEHDSNKSLGTMSLPELEAIVRKFETALD